MTSMPNSPSPTAVPRLAPSDWILLWLSLDDTDQVRGKTRLMKQLFVVGKEVVPQAFPSFEFFPHHFGPYSRVLEKALSDLDARELIDVVPRTECAEGSFTTDVKRYDYILTDRGQDRAKTLQARLPGDVTHSLVGLKRILSKMGYYGLLSYVYRTYPEYTTMSELDLSAWDR